MTMTMSHTYNSLRSAIGYFLGYGRDASNWSYEMVKNIDFCLMEGLRQYYYPANGYIWSWLVKTTPLTVSSFSTTLPADFGALLAEPTFYVTDTSTITNTDRIYRVLPEDIYRALHRFGYKKGAPNIVSVEYIFSMALTEAQRQKLLCYPAPDTTYYLNIRYMAKPEPLNPSTNQYPLGGEPHARTVLESCLAAAEAFIGDTMGLHQQRFMEALEGSIRFDMEHKLPSTYGFNIDPSVSIGYDISIKHTIPSVGYIGSTEPYTTPTATYLNRLERAVAAAFGSADGIIRTDDELYFKVIPSTPASLIVTVLSGLGWVSQRVIELSEDLQLEFTLPTNNNRIDLIQYTLDSGVNIKQGIESSDPQVPSLDNDSIPLASVLLTPTTSAITTSDITDLRNFV